MAGSALVFLLPLATAIAGAALAGNGGARQVAGAALGFLVGVVVAMTVTRLIRPRET
ncbi:MAG: hypothetical protein JXB04_05165 [Kiritimatiellae bacterium]|nr:hypothetical protein [Kiritimatiellia bacterium]